MRIFQDVKLDVMLGITFGISLKDSDELMLLNYERESISILSDNVK